MEKNRLLLLGIFLVVLLLAWLVYLQFLELGNVKEEQCHKLNLTNEEGGNCCFIDDNEEGLLPRYRAVPCDNLLYVPIEKQIERGELSNFDLPKLNLTSGKFKLSFNEN